MNNPVRLFLITLSLAFASTGAAVATATADRVGSRLSNWTEGCLDIHFINTGRGETALLILPDGTTLVVDAPGSQFSSRTGACLPSRMTRAVPEMDGALHPAGDETAGPAPN